MKIELTPEQERARREFRRFAKDEIEPNAGEWDRAEQLPRSVIQQLAERKYLGSIVPKRWGGAGLDMISYGLMHEEFGRACSSLRSLITVHDMVAIAILKWGSDDQKSTLLPRLTSGSAIACFAASEPEVGSEIAGIKTTAIARNGGFCLSGKKKWITGGQIADLFLVLAKSEGKPTTFLLERNRPNFDVKPIHGMLGTKASMLAELTFNECPVRREDILGKIGFGFLTAVSTGLGLGRYSVACGCVGIAQACLDASLHYANSREQFGALLRDHQLIQQLLSDMVTNVRAARLLCYHAGYLKQAADPGEEVQTFIAKYFASRAAMKSATDAVQIHGATGCTGAHTVERHFRDAKIMEIIEGSTQIQQMMIARQVYPAYLAELQQQAGATEPAAVLGNVA
ncbi:MAG: hypothetical protein V7638_4493 [Acidobacteriota bacterium]|jgi:alkylation response protein AidB-like acyl-CoA dehydrogenase